MTRHQDAATETGAGQNRRALLAKILRERACQVASDHELSSGQQALWFLHRSLPESPAYNTAFCVRVRCEVNFEALRGALETLTARHSALRTTFPLRDGGPVQRVHGYCDVSLEQVDASSWSRQRLEDTVHADYRQPFDLERGPLIRTGLYSSAKDDHVLLLAFHHIICDAWSIWMLMHELGVLYSAALCGHRPDLSPVQRQFHEFVAWQNEMLAGAEGEKLWQYWRERLQGELPVLALPTDRPHPPLQSLRGESHFFTISDPLMSRLGEVGQRQGATLYMILLAAFQTLLHRYSGQDDIIVGSPVVGRNLADFSATVGYFANPIPARADLSGNPTFSDFLSQVRHTVLDGLTHQEIPFPRLVEQLQPVRVPGRWPVFQVMFILQRPPQSDDFRHLFALESEASVRWGDLDMEPFQLAQMEGQFDLTWEAVERSNSLSCVLKYNTDLFDRSTIERMEGHLRTLLEGIVANPKQRLADLPILTTAERRQLTSQWNATHRDYRLDRCLHHWIEDQVQRTPDQPAVVLDATEAGLTYHELNARANQLARHLRQLGVGSETLVGICARRSLEMVVALLGILKAGAAYVPLDPDFPPDRLAFLFNDAQAPVLLTLRSLAQRVPAASAQVVLLDSDWDEIAKLPDNDLHLPIGPEFLAYVIYTSGSTGQPKGAANTHRGICNRLLWMQEEYGLDDSDRVLQKTPYSFDVSVWEYFWPLMTGARLVLAKPMGHKDRDYLVDVIARHRITTLHFVPSMLQVFLEAAQLPRCNETLRRVICSGEALPYELQQRFFDRLDAELHNLYGPTEAAIDVTHWPCRRDSQPPIVPIGRPIANTQIHILDKHLKLVPVGVPAELHIGGIGLARGYWNRPALTAEKFIPDPFRDEPSARLYKTGDVCRRLPDGSIEYLHRLDDQVKIRGFRIELGEIESALAEHPKIREAAARVDRTPAGDARLLAWLVPVNSVVPTSGELRQFLTRRLPDYMVPAAYVTLDRLPLTPSGKCDRRTLPAPTETRPELADTTVVPRTEAEQKIAGIWREVLPDDNFGIHDNFFDLGGHSLLLAQVQTRLMETFGRSPTVIELFQFPTIATLAAYFGTVVHPKPARSSAGAPAVRTGESRGELAVVGMSCRFPGAADVAAFWQNLLHGAESISHFSEEELLAQGIDAELVRNPNYVGAHGAIEGKELFDAAFFSFTPREAELTDVQQRLLLECAWTALEHSGHDPHAEGRRCGVFVGVGPNTYLLNNLYSHGELREAASGYQLLLANDKDYTATRVSYKLNLTGPSVTVQTACSTSLVAVHLACRSVLAGECDMALAGGCSISVPGAGYLFQPEMILSPDGHCRAFDKDAHGTVGGSGAGIVVVKRLADALDEGDTIYAVIKGSAINNDGSLKAGYTAPSIDGQAAVVAAALDAAGVEADSISYIEAHGTGTSLGDPIEIAALNKVLRDRSPSVGPCALGSVKTNVGHLDTTAGIAGLIKTALALHHEMLPPSLHFREPNPKMEWTGRLLRVNDRLQPWSKGELPRRAGVSSFGIGGTNAHVVLEESPPIPETGPARSWQLVTLSARNVAALDATTANLAGHLRAHPDSDLADTAFTLACGRRHFDYRRALVCRNTDDALHALAMETREDHRTAGEAPRVSTSAVEPAGVSVAFMFSGQGSQYANMAKELYENELVFREQVDHCSELLSLQMKLELRDVLFPDEQRLDAAAEQLRQTALAQPALFVIEYALSRLWGSWGVRPEAMIGHSIGEYVAACLSGVVSLEDALALVARRGEIMQRMPAGSMLAVSLAEDEVRPLLGEQLFLAVVNGLNMCVVSGPHAAVFALAEQLEAQGVACRRLRTSHAFHSAMMEPAVAEFRECVARVELSPPQIPFVSNVTGTWIEPGQATDPDYWAQHLLRTVRFHEGLVTLLDEPGRLLIEVGPGNVLGNLAARHPQRSTRQAIVTSTRHATEAISDVAHLMEAAGKVWLAGAPLDWHGFYQGQRRQRLPLPTYPFQRQRYWIDAAASSGQREGAMLHAPKPSSNIDDWFFIPSWQRAVSSTGAPEPGSQWLLFLDRCRLGDSLAQQLQQHGACVTRVRLGPAFGRHAEGEYALNPSRHGDFDLLLQDLSESDRMPQTIVHLWNCTSESDVPRQSAMSAAARDASFFSLIHLAQSLGEHTRDESCRIVVVSNGLHNVTGAEHLHPIKALLLGPVAVIPQEYANLRCTSVDVDIWAEEGPHDRIVKRLIAESTATESEPVVAYRGGHRWVQRFVPTRLEPQRPHVREQGVYLITGGTGGLGLELAEWLIRNAAGAKLVLTSRPDFPPRTNGRPTFFENEAGHVGDKFDRLSRLEQLGADVFIMAADVSDPVQMRSAIGRIRERFGQIHGVIHAAGVAGGGMIRIKTREDAESEFAARVSGSLVLDEVLADQPLDFFVLCSSQTSATGGIGQVAYCASCAFLDAFAEFRTSQQRGDTQVISIDWDRWQGLGMAVRVESLHREFTGRNLAGGLNSAEGSEAFSRILAAGIVPRIVVSTRNFPALLRQSQAYQLGQFEQQSTRLQLHARPDLATDYVAPANDTERRIARIWEEELGIDRVGTHDEFMSLGGDSLLAIKLVARLRDTLQIQLNVRSLYEQPTVATLAEHVAAVRWAAEGEATTHTPVAQEEGAL